MGQENARRVRAESEAKQKGKTNRKIKFKENIQILSSLAFEVNEEKKLA